MFSTVPPPRRVSRLMHAARYWPSQRTAAVILWHSVLEFLLVLVLLFGATTFVCWMVLLIAWFLAVPGLAPLVPGLVGFLVGLAIAVLGPITGGSLNPARQLGPAIFSGDHDFLWVYLLAPMVGAALATMLFKLLTRRRVLTHKLCGTHKDGPPR